MSERATKADCRKIDERRCAVVVTSTRISWASESLTRFRSLCATFNFYHIPPLRMSSFHSNLPSHCLHIRFVTRCNALHSEVKRSACVQFAKRIAAEVPSALPLLLWRSTSTSALLCCGKKTEKKTKSP